VGGLDVATCRNFFGRQAAGLLCHFLRGLIGIVTPKEVGKVRKGTVDWSRSLDLDVTCWSFWGTMKPWSSGLWGSLLSDDCVWTGSRQEYDLFLIWYFVKTTCPEPCHLIDAYSVIFL
jgi:hypothetical protein